MKQTISRFFRDKHGEVVIAQRPNWPIILWFLLIIPSHFISDRTIHRAVSIAASLVLLYWAYLEIKSGASPFRRTLGAVVAIVSLYSIYSSIT